MMVSNRNFVKMMVSNRNLVKLIVSNKNLLFQGPVSGAMLAFGGVRTENPFKNLTQNTGDKKKTRRFWP